MRRGPRSGKSPDAHPRSGEIPSYDVHAFVRPAAGFYHAVGRTKLYMRALHVVFFKLNL